MRWRYRGLALDRHCKCSLSLDIDACQRAKTEVSAQRGGGARRQIRKAANQSMQDVEKLHLLARHPRIAEKAEFPVKILDRERVGIVIW